MEGNFDLLPSERNLGPKETGDESTFQVDPGPLLFLERRFLLSSLVFVFYVNVSPGVIDSKDVYGLPIVFYGRVEVATHEL